jgi:hypothetical protein
MVLLGATIPKVSVSLSLLDTASDLGVSVLYFFLYQLSLWFLYFVPVEGLVA